MTIRSPVRGRECGSCTLCCKLINVISVDKARGEWCKHCNPKGGCNIYADRPYECTTFLCGYLAQEQLGEHWFPKKSRMVLIDRVGPTGSNITIFVDDTTPNIWREPLYYREIKGWAQSFPPEQVQVLVIVRDRSFLILPDKDIDLGDVRPDQMIVTTRIMTPTGPVYGATVMEGNDPRIAGRGE